MGVIFRWQGPGWYGSYDTGGKVYLRRIGTRRQVRPDAEEWRVRRVRWYDAPPARAQVKFLRSRGGSRPPR